MTGKTIAHYRLIEKIGAGGMGEVYRAADTRLGRDVAMKILPAEWARDAERMARFQREAKLLAQLNHPNIAAIYGLESEDDVTALVLELVEGETLAERIQAAPLSVDETVRVARQIAEAIESAHERGIVHRDLKPANVKFTADDNVKVLDFGLARAFDADPQSAAGNSGASLDSPTISPAMTSPVITGALTGMNVILGTAAYMSPEQARGKPVDRRADIWSFGVVCFEMLTGKRLFEGETVSDTLAAVLKTDPDWDTLPAETPEPLRRLLQRCLERDPRQRLRDIGEARVRLELWSQDPSTMLSVTAAAAGDDRADASARRRGPAGGSWTSRYGWIVAAAVAVAALILMRSMDSAPEPLPPLELEIHLAEQDDLRAHGGLNLQFSPDGRLLAYLTNEGLRVRPLDRRESRLLPGTRRSGQFAFSPDGQWIAFISDGKLQRISVTGGTPIELSPSNLVSRGIAWINPETIVFTPNFTGGMKTLNLETGEVRDLTVLDSAAEERSHRWPSALPDGRSVLFLCQFQGQDYDEGEIRMITVGEERAVTVHRGGSAPAYSPTGHLLFVKDKTVFAVRMDPETGTTHGMPVPVLGGIWASVDDQESDDGSAQFGLSPQGMLIYRTDPAGQKSVIMAADASDGTTARVGTPGIIDDIRVSPDGTLLAVWRGDMGEDELFVEDLRDGSTIRITLGEGALGRGGWGPDSRMLYWQQTADRVCRVYTGPADGSLPARELMRVDDGRAIPSEPSPDGKELLFVQWLNSRPAETWDILAVNLETGERRVLVDGPGNQSYPRFSPDGRWLAYLAEDGQSFSIFLRRYPDTGAQWRITGGGMFYTFDWARDGTAVFVRDEEGAYRIPIELGKNSPRIGQPEAMFPAGLIPRALTQFEGGFTEDGSKLYYLSPDRADSDRDRIILVTDWFGRLNDLAP